jgi:L-rhamnose isomerase/sugar isomerase
MALGSESLTVWLADGSCFPGQLNFRKAFQNTLEGLQQIYAALPDRLESVCGIQSF